jgi:acyl-coenzyme A thioesterase PaaI-like protein
MAPKGSSTDDLPDVFRARFAGREEQHSTLRPGDYFHACFGCGPAHPDGLHVRCFKTPDGVESPVLVAPRYEGPPGTVHGGIVAAYLDEILGAAAARAAGRPAITGELTVRYVKPVPIATPLLGRGRLVTDHGKYVDVAGSLEWLATGEVVATARGRFFPVRPASPDEPRPDQRTE